MTELVLDVSGAGVVLPESQKGGYRAELTPLSVDVEMISGRLTREKRGSVWVVNYQYGYFDDGMKERVIAACRKGQGEVIVCGFLEPTSGGELTYRRFLVTSFQHPKFMWSRPGEQGTPVPMWGDFAVTLREVKPNATA